MLVDRAHIQNFSDAATLEPHWGYAFRVVPCTNDAGSCEYLDSVYWSHDVSMLYSFILWAVIGGILFVWCLGRHFIPSRRSDATALREEGERPTVRQTGLYRLTRSAKVTARHYLLPESMARIFGRTTRLQILTLAILAGYLLVFSFIGIVYKRWITPVKNLPGVYNTRSGLGPWSNRVGVLAFALTPLSVILSSRESLLSLITGIPYQHFNFLHRWLGYIVFLQSAFHTLGWTIIEARLYQPQPKVWDGFISQLYMIWGVIAMIFLSFLFVFSTRWAIKLTGYEFFRKAHYAVAMLYIGACWGHWAQLNCWMIASLAVWFLDRGIRLVRTALIHYDYLPGSTSVMGFRSATASVTLFPDDNHGDVVRLDFEHNHDAWNIGQHFFLCFPELTMSQSHPFTPCSVPRSGLKRQGHSYILRGKKGATKKLADLARQKLGKSEREVANATQATAAVILAGPYGQSIVGDLTAACDINILCIAGGTGVTFVLPMLMSFVSGPQAPSGGRRVEFIWAIRKRSDMFWIRDELKTLELASKSSNLKISIFVTREDDSVGKSSTVPDLPDTSKNEFITIEERESQPDTSSASQDSDIEVASPSSSSSVSPDPVKELTSRSPSFAIHQARVPAVFNPSTSRPDIGALVKSFVSSIVRGPARVFASGPGGMVSDLRDAIAACNSAGKVWKGDERYDVELVNDDRLEW
ncbi:hypothetical protein H2201_006309 [Coniosporium apollinis]|uniref:FAD-binding FR-type domain-containing protein n=2 Tax=Coniosporium TaxID=2810619 RepID=A0ABQ9NMF6_9PEZI|nr:hypothetical protein H2199_004969 [Cladosporium sp. JES 115]KAJ9661829.1 hypothetical protein H2201_006309 [Coniosporium apollinis]